jgi:midasin
MILIDEINMAEDSVLERLNSVLESDRKLLITELNQEITAGLNFSIVATMNPGGNLFLLLFNI